MRLILEILHDPKYLIYLSSFDHLVHEDFARLSYQQRLPLQAERSAGEFVAGFTAGGSRLQLKGLSGDIE